MTEWHLILEVGGVYVVGGAWKSITTFILLLQGLQHASGFPLLLPPWLKGEQRAMQGAEMERQDGEGRGMEALQSVSLK